MKKLFSILFVLGLIEVFYGLLWGRLQIYKFELPMSRALGLSIDQHAQFGYYITAFKDQWRVVAGLEWVNTSPQSGF